MNFRLSDDERALQEAVRRLVSERFSIERVRKVELPAGPGFDRELWRELGAMGLFGLREPEARGGAGLGMASAVLAFIELGRRLVPGPTIWTHLGAGLIDGAATGKVIVGGADRTGPVSDSILVEHFEQLEALLVLHDEGIFRLDPKHCATRRIESLDPLTPLSHWTGSEQGERIAGPEHARKMRLEATLLVAAQMVGIAEATIELAVGYSKTREQFGRTIGSFQALKHIMADMLVRKEIARAAVYAAGATVDDASSGDVTRAIGSARVAAGEAAMKNARACIQVYGGMGYTWEAEPHYYLKRTWVLETSFGTTDENARLLGERIGR